jgi:hypothetical protein
LALRVSYKGGDKSYPYALFAKGLRSGKPPDSMDDLLRESQRLDGQK